MNGDINRSVGTSVICYFCNENIQNSYLLQHHVKQCGSILEKCSNNCGAWVERRNKSSHLRQCKTKQYGTMDSSSTLPPRSSMGAAIYQVFEERAKDDKVTENVANLKMEIENLKYVLCEEKNERDRLYAELEKLKRQYMLSEERNQIAMATLTALRRHIDDEFVKQRAMISEINAEFNNIHLKNQGIKDFTTQAELRIDNLEKIIDFERNERSHLELIINTQDGKLRFLNKLEEDVDILKNEKSQIDLSRNDKIFAIQNELRELKTLLTHENLQTKQQLQNFQLSQDEYTRSILDTKVKQETIEYDLKTLKVTEDENKMNIEMINKSIDSLSKTLQSLQKEERRVKVVENNNIQRPLITTGRLLWRVPDYHEKMKDSISNGTIYQSEIFLSGTYGYTLQAELNLNGIGKWQGRHLIATVYILPGEYDPILEWPVSLVADVIIKDQTPKKLQSQDITKTLIVKKRENSSDGKLGDDKNKQADTKSSHDLKRQYVFIPHTTLDKLDFVKNNTMFIEIIVSKP